MQVIFTPKKQIDDIETHIGNPTQLYTNDKTILGFATASYKHIHNPAICYPDNGDTIDVDTSATAKTYGSFVDVIPINTIDRAYDIHWVSIADITATGSYILDFHKLDSNGDSLGVIGQIHCSRTDNFSRVGPQYLQIPVQQANSRIGVRARKATAGAGTVKFVIQYHDYL